MCTALYTFKMMDIEAIQNNYCKALKRPTLLMAGMTFYLHQKGTAKSSSKKPFVAHGLRLSRLLEPGVGDV